MRAFLIAVLGLSLGAATAANAQGDHATSYGSFAPNKSPPKATPGGGFAPLPGSEPYRTHTRPAQPNVTKPIGSFGGSEGFKPYKAPEPFKGSSVYGTPKPAKPKSSF